MSMLSPSAQLLLKELQMDPRWGDLLSCLASSVPPIPAFREPRSEEPLRSTQASHDHWVYYSGLNRGRTELLHILGYRNGKDRLE